MAITHATAADGSFSGTGATEWNKAHVGIAGDGGFAFKYAFDTATSGTPATGTIQLNNATPSAASTMYIYETDATGTGIDTILDLINPTDFVMLSNSDRSKYHVFQCPLPFTSGASIDNLPVRWLSGTGAGATNFTNTEQIFLSIVHADFDDVMGLSYMVGRGMCVL